MSSSVVLTVGRFDPRGLTGIQRDMKTILELGGVARTVATFCISGSDRTEIFRLPADLVENQLNGLIDENVGALKIGNLCNSEMMNMIADFVEGEGKQIPLILEPVMTAARNSSIVLDQEAIQAFERRLFFHATLLCPNLTEAYRLTGLEITSLDTMRHAAEMLMTLGNEAVLLTGGSLPGEYVHDVFMDADHQEVFTTSRDVMQTTEGTGDALTAAIAHGVAAGKKLRHAIIDARRYIQDSIRHDTELQYRQDQLETGKIRTHN